MKKTNIIFCILSLAISLLIAFTLFPLVSLRDKELQNAVTPKSAEKFEAFDLGDFGSVTVMEMLEHYISSPPEEVESVGSSKEKLYVC